MSITKLNCMELKDTRYSVYPYDGYNLEEILGKFYEAIKECNDLSFSLQEFNTWLIDVGLIEEVEKQLTKVDWDNIVNSELYQKVIERLLNTNNRIEEVKNELSSQLETIVLKQEVSVTDFGAKGDGVTDDTIAINNAILTQKPLFFPQGIYVYNGDIDLTNVNNVIWRGEGSSVSVIKFKNNVVSGIKRINGSQYLWHMTGIKLIGEGKKVGNSIHGIYSDNMGKSTSYNLLFKDIICEQFSGNGFFITDWFQQQYEGCNARSIGCNAFEIGGDQFTTFINSGAFNSDVDGWSWWFYSGNPFLQNLNCGNVGSGLRLGKPSSHKYGESYCRPTLIGLNVEHCKVSGTGIKLERGSSFAYVSGISIYANETSGNVAYGIYAEYLSNTSYFAEMPKFEKIGNVNFDNTIYIKGVAPNCGIICFSQIDYSNYDINTKNAFINLVNKNGYLSTTNMINTPVGFYNEGVVMEKVKTINSSINIRRDTGTQDDYILLCDASNGELIVSLDYPSYLPYRKFIIKKIDSTSNKIKINGYGGKLIDGNNNKYLTSQYETITIINDTNNWFIIGN